MKSRKLLRNLMAKPYRQSRRDVGERWLKLFIFVHNRRTPWTINDIVKLLGIDKKNARGYLETISLLLPVAEIDPPRYEPGTLGRLSGTYLLIKG